MNAAGFFPVSAARGCGRVCVQTEWDPGRIRCIMTALLVSCGRSDVGLRRQNNEDAYIIRPEQGLSALADGMGGGPFGEEASRVFAETALEMFSKPGAREQELASLVQETFRSANERILQFAREDPARQGMGCTVELMALRDWDYILGHVGDSRTYLLRQGGLRQITRDHSLVQEQIDKGLITREEARTHSRRNVILRAVGVNEVLAVDLIRGRAAYGDIFLLCSDGLTGMVDDMTIRDVLSSADLSLELRAEHLVESAKSAGGHDNITVILSQVLNDHS